MRGGLLMLGQASIQEIKKGGGRRDPFRLISTRVGGFEIVQTNPSKEIGNSI